MFEPLRTFILAAFDGTSLTHASLVYIAVATLICVAANRFIDSFL